MFEYINKLSDKPIVKMKGKGTVSTHPDYKQCTSAELECIMACGSEDFFSKHER